MSKKLAYERFYWSHNKVKAEQYPNAAHLAEKFETFHRTSQLDIEFMRNRLHTPLKYDYSMQFPVADFREIK